MKQSEQIILGVVIGFIILFVKVVFVMFHDYHDSRITSTVYIDHNKFSFPSREVVNYIEKNYTCGFELHYLSGGGHMQGSDYCNNSYEIVEIYWDYSENRMVGISEEVSN